MDWRPGTCSLGFDWGSTLTKATLAYINKYGRKEIIRVPWQGDMSDPEHPETSRHPSSSFGFVSSAALVPAKDGPGSQLSVGRPSLWEDENFPTKTLLLWAAGIRRSAAIQNAPCGPEIIQASHEGKINMEMVRQVFLEHFRLVYSQARTKAEILRLEIVHISITHPNFLCDGEEPDDFLRWQELYKWVVREICGEGIRISMISEGQAVAMYITEIFEDPLGSFNRTKFWNKMRHLNKSEGLKLLVLDCGGSTTNVQVQLAFFNDEHEMTASQSVSYSNWKTGVQGGSHLANFKVRALIEKTLGPNLKPGELAALLDDFEGQKRFLDWTKTPLPTITLRGKNPLSRFPISPELLKPIFKSTFQGGLDCLREMGSNMLRFNRDFGIVLCGGSYFSQGLRSQVDDVVKQLKNDAKERDINVESVFLANCDTNWSSGVSAGAALSVLRLPYPTDALDHAAIGVQMQWPKAGGGLEGEDYASFLLSKGCQTVPSITVWRNPARPDPITFTLVCDPVYYRTPPGYYRRPRGYGDKVPRVLIRNPFFPIQIERRQQTIPAYELGFSFQLSDLPIGDIKISMGGDDAFAFAENSESLKGKRALMFELTAYKVNKRGIRMPHRLDKRWLLRYETDAATKHVIVEDAKEVPGWCICPDGPQGEPPVHTDKMCRGSLADSGRRSDRLVQMEVAQKEVETECPPHVCPPEGRFSRPRKPTRKRVKKTTDSSYDGTCIQVATPPRSISPGYWSITSLSSDDDY